MDSGRKKKEEDHWTPAADSGNVSKFMESPLVRWVKTFKKSKEALDFEELSDSVFLLDVLLTLDGGNDRELSASINRSASMDSHTRMHNWMLLVQTIHRYYSESLQQVVLMSWPDPLLLAGDCNRGACLVELQKFLILLLGYAVQCDCKEEYIETIKTLDVDAQQALVSHIQQVTEVPRNVLQFGDKTESDCILLIEIVQSLCQERLQNIQRLVSLAQENDSLMTDGKREKSRLTSAAGQDSKTRIRLLTEEIDEKNKLLAETRQQLCAVSSELSKMKSENIVLATEAKSARIYKDELDSIRETTIKAEKYRKEIARYKEKMLDIDFYRTRIEDLRKDNDLLMESKAKTELQLTSANKRIEKIMDELVFSQIQLENNSSEKTEVNKKLMELGEENARLQYENTQLKSGILSSNLQRFMSATSIDCLSMTDFSQPRGTSISDEVNETLTTHLTRIQLENEDLRMKLKEAMDKHEDCKRELEQMRREEKNFQTKLVTIQRQTSEESKRNSMELSKHFEQKISEMEQRSIRLKQRVSKEFQHKLSDMEEKNKNLQQHIEELQKQIQFIEDTWNRDRELCARLHGANEDLIVERQQLKRGISHIQHSCRDKIDTLQTKADLIEKETENLQMQNRKIYDLCNNSFTSVSSELSPRQTPSRLNDSRISFACSRSGTEDLNSSFRSVSSSKGNASVADSPVAKSMTTPVAMTTKATEDSKGRTPIRGIVTPQRRTTDASDVSSCSSQLSIHQPTQKPSPDLFRDNRGSSISRNDKFRHSMPVKMSVIPNYRLSSLSGKGTPKTWNIAGQKVPIPQGISHSNDAKAHHAPPYDRSFSDNRSTISSRYGNDASFNSHLNTSNMSSDSRSSSLRRPQQPRDSQMEGSGRTPWQYFSSERTVTRTSETISLEDDESRYKALVDHIIRLQDQNKQLHKTNTELRQSQQVTEAIKEKLNILEESNLKLEVENRKLKQIISSLQGVPQSLYDKRTYQFNTIV